MSFDRPDYLTKVLESLKTQLEPNLDARSIVLFQDGAVSPFSGKKNASPASVRQSVAAFRSIFPQGTVMASDVNLGVALNFDRAEKYVYEELGAEAAIFLEDDLVLSPYYISTIDVLIDRFVHDERVGYVSAYGDHTKSLEEQEINRDKLILLGHNWAFALFRRQWLKMRGRVLEYLDVIKGCDYKDRDGEKIKTLFASWGYGDPAISQDAAKTIACCLDGVVKLNTYVCNASYIGERGLHMNPKIYADRGYSRTVVYPKAIRDFEPLSNTRYQRLLREQMDWAKTSRSSKIGAEKPSAVIDKSSAPAGSGQMVLNEQVDSRFGSQEFIKAAYRALLKREPDANGLEAYRRQFIGRPLPEAIQRTISGLIKSAEFARKWEVNREVNRDSSHIPGVLMLAVQRALISRIPSSLRGVSCGRIDNRTCIRFVFDGEIDQDDRQCVKEVADQLSQDFDSGDSIVPEIVRLDCPEGLDAYALQAWAFMRRE